LYLAVRNACEKWTMPIRDWGQALNRFAIEERERTGFVLMIFSIYTIFRIGSARSPPCPRGTPLPSRACPVPARNGFLTVPEGFLTVPEGFLAVWEGFLAVLGRLREVSQ
jgi:hypothetical protein